jgi:DNA invertase Pin-like site-specific DNA recombinase
MKNNLVFAPLVRVSTEVQARMGESLSTQRKQLESAIKSINGMIYKWYSGPEHATPDQERKILEELMVDAHNQKFNAIMVADVSRWSRDNLKSAEYLKILRDKKIRFFVLTNEYDLFNNHHELFLTMGVAINQFFAKEQAYKSTINRIERAKRGYPSCGKLPFGRKFNEVTERWDIIPEDQEKIIELARRYLEEGIAFKILGSQFRMNPSNLHKILTKRCGEIWEQRFRNKACGIDETVRTIIPPLLPERVIEMIRSKCIARRTWEHGSQKYQYLFSRMIFDKDTGYSLTGTPSPKGKRYYRPYHTDGNTYMVNADLLEVALLRELFKILGSNECLQQAVFENSSAGDHVNNLIKRKAMLEKDHETLMNEYTNIANAIAKYERKGLETFLEKLQTKLDALHKRSSEIKFEMDTIDNNLNTLPTKDEIENSRNAMRREILKLLRRNKFRRGAYFNQLPFKEKQNIIRLLFSGVDQNGKRYGIYIRLIEGRPRRYEYEAYGRLITMKGWIEGKTGKFETDARIDENSPENQNTSNEIAKVVKKAFPKFDRFENHIKECMPNKFHAHYRFSVHQ